jgi:hypothetical protein
LPKPNTGTRVAAEESPLHNQLEQDMDEADLAFDSEQRHLTLALAAQRRRGGVLQPIGSCHHCGQDAVAGRLFCDQDCAADWEYEDGVRRKLGLSGGASRPEAPAYATH